MQFAEDRIDVAIFINGEMRRQVTEQPAAFRFGTVRNAGTGRAGIDVTVVQRARDGSVFEGFPAPLCADCEINLVAQELERRNAAGDAFQHQQ